jgi:hypothetical protein
MSLTNQQKIFSLEAYFGTKESFRHFQAHYRTIHTLLLAFPVSFLHLYPYKIQIKQKLTDADKEKRVTMCEWFCNVLKMTKTFFCPKMASRENIFCRCVQDIFEATIAANDHP